MAGKAETTPDTLVHHPPNGEKPSGAGTNSSFELANYINDISRVPSRQG
jgi:hypothetical protein